MKTLLRAAAALSFFFFFAGGCLLLGKAAPMPGEDLFPLVALGLVFVGTGFFVGAILLVAAERFGRKQDAG